MAYPYSYLPSTTLPYQYGAAGVAGYTAGYTSGYAAAAAPVSYTLPSTYAALPQYVASPYSFGQYTQLAASPFGLSVPQAQIFPAQPKSAIKLTYFDMTGLAESIRLTLFVGGISFEDERVSRDEFTANLKQNTRFGQLPILEVGGKVLAQSNAQLIFAGTLAGLYPEDAWERARVNEALFLAVDLLQLFVPIRAAKTDEDKEKATKNANDNVPRMIGYIEKLLTETNTGYLAGPKLTVADIVFHCYLSFIETLFADVFPADLFDNFPRVKEFRARIAALPRVAEWNTLQEQKKAEKEAAEQAKKAQEEADADAAAAAAAVPAEPIGVSEEAAAEQIVASVVEEQQ